MAFQPNREGVLAALVIGALTAPFAYAATVLLGWPAFLLLQKIGRLSAGPAMGAGAVAAIVVVVLIRQWLHPRFETTAGLVASVGGCLLSGVLSAFVFYRIVGESDRVLSRK